MKNIILVIVVLLIFIGGLGWFIFTSDNLKEPPPKTKAAEDKNTKPIKVDDNATKPAKELTKEDIVGEYEITIDGNTGRLVFLENGVYEVYDNGKKKEGEGRWKLTKEWEIHVTAPDEETGIFRINKDGSITPIAGIKDAKREESPKDKQIDFKKIK